MQDFINKCFYYLNEKLIPILNMISLVISLGGGIINFKSDNDNIGDRKKKVINRIMIVFISASCLFSLVHIIGESLIEMPSVIDLQYEQAIHLLSSFKVDLEHNADYSGGYYYVTDQEPAKGTIVSKNNTVVKLVCEKITADIIVEPDMYSVDLLDGNIYTAEIGDIIEIKVNLLTPEKNKFETTPFIFQVAYYDMDIGNWVQISPSEYISVGEQNYRLKIDTGLLGLSAGEYTFLFDLFEAKNYSAGRSRAYDVATIILTGDKKLLNEGISGRKVVSYAVANDFFTINGSAYDKNITELNLNDITNKDLRKLVNCKNLEKLFITGENLTDLSPLQKLTSLEVLHINSKFLEDLTPISSLTGLKNLGVGGMEINGIGFSGWLSDISAISTLTNLESLTISDCQVEDISAISSLSNLKSLWVYKTQVDDITPIEDLVLLEDLRIHSNKISDISVLYKLTNLKYLTLSFNDALTDEQVNSLSKTLPNCSILFRKLRY